MTQYSVYCMSARKIIKSFDNYGKALAFAKQRQAYFNGVYSVIDNYSKHTKVLPILDESAPKHQFLR